MEEVLVSLHRQQAGGEEEKVKVKILKVGMIEDMSKSSDTGICNSVRL
jgi:hypothetical protein